MSKKIRGNHLLAIGYKPGRPIGVAIDAAKKMLKRMTVEDVLDLLEKVLDDPKAYLEHAYLFKVAETLVGDPAPKVHQLLDEPMGYEVYGADNIERGAIDQMDVAMSLPITRKGALMPDAHQGYGLPIGGVLAVENAVIPYGVGVDIGCRMCMTIYDLGEDYVGRNRDMLKKALVDHTRFGMVDVHDDPADHDIFDRSEFRDIEILRQLKNKTQEQMGTSGGGNHFVEFGDIEILVESSLGIAPGKYTALLSHSGSRGFGAQIARHYTAIAKKMTALPKHAGYLAWLDLDTEEGQEYWLAMNLALDYAAACHHDIHRRLGKQLRAKPIIMVENHHNFAAKEIHDGVEYVVHRKGATPAGKNVFGIIPGTMADFGYLVRGLGNDASLKSASHGAGRVMSRSQAKNSFTGSYMRKYLRQRGITLIGGGLDEHPEAYKKIDEVMGHQETLVEAIGRFYPKVVRMADDAPPKWRRK